MTRYRYEGFNNRTETKRGFVDAESEGEAAGKLRDLGLFVQKLEPDSPEPMRQVLPGGNALPDVQAQAQAVVDKHFQAVMDPRPTAGRTYQAPAPTQAPVEPAVQAAPRGPDEPWQGELRTRIKSILEVYRFLPEVKKELAGLPPDAAKQAYFEAFNELLKDAIKDAELTRRKS